jgi:hypothetical protein
MSSRQEEVRVSAKQAACEKTSATFHLEHADKRLLHDALPGEGPLQYRAGRRGSELIRAFRPPTTAKPTVPIRAPKTRSEATRNVARRVRRCAALVGIGASSACINTVSIGGSGKGESSLGGGAALVMVTR